MEKHHHHHLMREGLHLGFEIAKLALKSAAIAAALLTVCELHKIHKGIVQHHKSEK